MQERSGATCHIAMPQCCYLAKGAKRPSHTTNTIKFDRIPFDPCNSIKRFDLCPFDQKNSTYLQPPIYKRGVTLKLRLLMWEYNLENNTGLYRCGFITQVVGFYVYSTICYFYDLRWGRIFKWFLFKNRKGMTCVSIKRVRRGCERIIFSSRSYHRVTSRAWLNN